MDCLVRIKSPQKSTENRYSFTLQDTSGHLLFLIKRTDSSTGWSSPFRVWLYNSKNEVQIVDIPSCSFPELPLLIKPYIFFTKKPERQFWNIPAHIFQTWKAGTKTPEMEAAQATFEKQTGYVYGCFNDEQCAGFLYQEFGERYKNAYVNLVPGAYRADFWRYCILYKFGGVYADAKTTLFRNLDEIIRPQDELVLVRDIPSQCLLNGFIACKKNHPLLKIIIDMTLERIEKREYGVDPLDITGPHIFGRAFCKWMGVVEDTMTLTTGYTSTIQILERSEDKEYIISPEGEKLMQKEYKSYYKNDVDVRIHYPQLWAAHAVYADEPPYKH